MPLSHYLPERGFQNNLTNNFRHVLRDCLTESQLHCVPRKVFFSHLVLQLNLSKVIDT
jgi:hypothetical protein